MNLKRKLPVPNPVVWFALFFLVTLIPAGSAQAQRFISDSAAASIAGELISMYGGEHEDRIVSCINRVADHWHEDDGSAYEFKEFCRLYYLADADARQKTFDRLGHLFEVTSRHFGEVGREFGWHMTVVTGPMLPIDYITPRFSPWRHFNEDMFATKIAFVALLNFPQYTLEEKLQFGPEWTRQQWAEVRLAEDFSARVPPEISKAISEAHLAAGRYIDEYNIFMHHLLTPDGSRPFPEGKRLISHWNLRDELKAQYSEPDGLDKQQMIYDVMLQIVRQEIPAAVINNPAVDWTVSTGEVTVSPVIDGDIPSWWQSDKEPGEIVDNAPESDTRYQRFLDIFRAHRLADPYYPDAPTMIKRRFERGRELPEADVEKLLTSITGSETIAKIGKLIEKRLGRPLRPFDIWYDGFKIRRSFSEEELDRIVREKYPTVAVFKADLPRIFHHIGFDDKTAEFLMSKIEVDPSRGIGHAAGPPGIGGTARLRTRVPEGGMDYKGYNIAIHELGHNVEQVFSTYRIDHNLLRGVPMTAMTEAFAFHFQDQDMELLGLAPDDPNIEHLKVLDNIWGVYEIGGVSLVDMRAWRWMYAHPDATAAELKEAVIAIAKDVWNEYFAPVLGVRDIEILAIYSHMIESSLYLPDYPMGSIVQFQIEEYLKDTGNIGEEIERICTIGSVTPGLWMETAVGAPISAEPLIRAAEDALLAVGAR